jgi:hypothetical protein
VYELVSRHYEDPAEFDEKAVDLLDQTIDRGYITEAVYASLFLLTPLPGSDVLAKAQWLFRENGVTAHDQLFAIAEATIGRDHRLLRILLDQYEPDTDLQLCNHPANTESVRLPNRGKHQFPPAGVSCGLRRGAPISSLPIHQCQTFCFC